MDEVLWPDDRRSGAGRLRVADACVNTLWDFRKAPIAAGAIDTLFEWLDRAIKDAGYLPMSGQIVDASLVAAPRQRN
ncbi:MAG: hypothetical protein ACXWVS_12910, partial [Hyphomicrobium sp.]